MIVLLHGAHSVHVYLVDMTFARILLWHCHIPPVELVRISHDVGENWNFDV